MMLVEGAHLANTHFGLVSWLNGVGGAAVAPVAAASEPTETEFSRVTV